MGAKPIRILQAVNVMDRAGLETMIMNHYRHIDRDLVQFDFLTHRQTRGAYDEEIEQLGGRIFRAPRLYPQNYIAYRKFMRRFFAEHTYPVVHSHIDAMSAFPLAMAQSCQVGARIAHSHNDSVDMDFKYPIKQIARKRLPNIATHFWACSEEAGVYLFGEKNRSKIHVVKNAIDLGDFCFASAKRALRRSELGLTDGQMLIGHVGRFSSVKNHLFIIKLLKELVCDGVDAVLALVGDGDLKDSIAKMASASGLSDRVRFLGLREDVNELLHAFDLFIYPSLHEGIPLALIEAQASGLPVLASDNVSAEALVLKNAQQLSLNAPMREWAQLLRRLVADGRASCPIEALASEGYEIDASAKSLTSSYFALYTEALS